MKILRTFGFIAFMLLFSTFGLKAQDKTDRPSPPVTAQAMVRGTLISIDYSAPAIKGRELWGVLVPYNKVWRTGANEATTLSVDKDVLIEGKLLKAGKYALFTIPGEHEWDVIINSVWDQWGAYNYDESADVLRFSTKALESDAFYETLTFSIDEGGRIVMNWGNLKVSFSVQSAK